MVRFERKNVYLGNKMNGKKIEISLQNLNISYTFHYSNNLIQLDSLKE